MRGWMAAVLLVGTAIAASAQNVEIRQAGPHNAITVRAVGEPGRYVGFDLLADDKLVVPVRFTSLGLIIAPNAEVSEKGGTKTLTFRSLLAAPESGLQLEKSRVTVTLTQSRFPVVDFDLHIAAFQPKKWQAVLGKQPFHFLTLAMPQATVWHHRGWLNATPSADMFPLLEDVHAGTPELSAYPYNREWSTTPPLSAHPLPVIGLWSPADRLYAAWDFQATRLTDNSERDIATGFCNRLVLPVKPDEAPPATLPPDLPVPGGERPEMQTRRAEQKRELDERDADRMGASKFVALVYPYGGQGYQQLVYPQGGERLASHAALVFSTDLGDTDDPNRFLWQTWWSDETLRRRLPHVPIVNDLSWIPADAHLQTLPGAPSGNLIGGVENPFQVPGTQLLYGWGWHNESPVLAPFKRKDKARMQALEREADTLVKFAKKFKADKETCVYWEKPLTGRWTDAWGGAPVTTLHNANGWFAGRLLLDLFRADKKTAYLPLVDGVFNWTKHIVWTRNEFADVPSSPFAIGGTAAASFLLDYYFSLRDDPAHRSRALQALDLARSFVYRYMVMWASDSIHNDGLDSAFLWEPNSGRDWTGAACSNEVLWDLDTLAQTAVHTGDPILMWALQGTLSRWPQLYQEVYRDNLAEYRAGDFTEGYALAPGDNYGYPGGRAPYGFGGALTMLDPVGDASVRVLAGEKAAMAFDRDGTHTTLRDYRCTGLGDFAFTLRTDLPTVTATVTFPYADLSDKPISILRNGITRIRLKPGKQIIRDANSLWSLNVTGLHDRDTVVVGAPDLTTAEKLPTEPPLIEEPLAARSDAQTAPFALIPLPGNHALNQDWQNPASFAPLPDGRRWVYGVPFAVDREHVVLGMVKLPEPIRKARVVYLLYAARTDAGGENLLPVPLLDKGLPAAPAGTTQALAWRAWPPLFTQRLLVAAFAVPPGRAVVGIAAKSQPVLAVTALMDGPNVSNVATQVNADMMRGTAEWRMLQAADRLAGELRQEAARLPQNAIAVLPLDPNQSPANRLLGRGGFRSRMAFLTPEQMVDPAQFSAGKFPVALTLDGEDYVDTVKTNGDAAEAVVRYVRDGGTLVLLSGLPYPMYYGTGPNGSHEAAPLLPRLGLPLVNALETMPEDTLTIEQKPGQTVLPGVPASFPYPSGDPRLRTVDRANLPAGADYAPIYHVRGRLDKDYGDAAALLTLPPNKDGKRGRILYISNVLLRDPDNGPLLLKAVLDRLAAWVGPPPNGQ